MGSAGYCKQVDTMRCTQNQYWDPTSQSCKTSHGQCSPDQYWDERSKTCSVHRDQPQPREEDFRRLQRDVRRLEGDVKRVERELQRMEKGGVVHPKEMAEKLDMIKKVLTALKSAKSFDEFEKLLPEGADVFNLDQDVRELEQYRWEAQENARRLNEVKRGIKNIDREVKTFEKKVNSLVAKKITVPQELLDTITKIKKFIELIKTAKTWDELQDAGIDDMPELFSDLHQYRSQLELISRWPDIARRVGNELKDVERDLARAKNIVARLTKRNIDVSALYGEMESLTTSLKGDYTKAQGLMEKGEVRDAMETLEQGFYERVSDMRGLYQVLAMVNNNFGGFVSENKKTLTDMNAKIRELKRRKIDTKELDMLLEKITETGNEVLSVIKQKGFDPEEVMTNIREFWSMRDEFWNIAPELSGEIERRPWEVGPGLFGGVPQLPGEWGNFFDERDGERGGRSSAPVAPAPATIGIPVQ